MDNPDGGDTIAPLHPFRDDSAAAKLVAVLDRELAGKGWQFSTDTVAWTADRDGEQTVYIEDGESRIDGPVITACDGDFRYVLRLPLLVTKFGMQRALAALVTLGVLPDGRYFA